MEQYFFSIGAFNPIYYSKYWMGLNTTREAYPSTWNWTTDGGRTPAPRKSTVPGIYSNWGIWTNPFDSTQTLMEPNSKESKTEYCVVADWLEQTNRTVTVPMFSGEVHPWGWNDQDCNRQFAFVCKYLPGARRCGELGFWLAGSAAGCARAANVWQHTLRSRCC